MPEAIVPPEYEPQAEVRKVDQSGCFVFKGRTLRAYKALAGKQLALRATSQDGLFELCYRRYILAQIDLRQDDVKTVHHVPEHVSTLSSV
ncbi:MAG: hypothetical protein P4L71_14570 [Acetobacteraceae bacterium]|nr:hypothetical protein [Acetobacteraceae bacterium]